MSVTEAELEGLEPIRHKCWWQGRDQHSPMALVRAWPEIERHPRIVYDGSPEAERQVRWYLARGRPFSVIIEKGPPK